MGIKHLLKIILLILVGAIIATCKTGNPTHSTDNVLLLPNIESIGDSNKIEIVTWNIERFPQNGLSDDYVKEILEGLNADIYVLQEIQSKSTFTNMLNDMADYNYLLHTNSVGLGLAVVYKNGSVKVKNSNDLFEEEIVDYFASRPPLLTKVEWQNNGITKELTIINVHYKCCGNNIISYVPDENGKWDEEYRRLKSSELLHSYIMANLSTENVIVGGDWNDAIQEPDSTNVFKIFIADSTNFKFADMNIATGDAANWSWQGWSSSYPAIHFDHILINKNLFDEFENSAVIEVIKLEEYFTEGITEYDENVSDHRPVYIKFSP